MKAHKPVDLGQELHNQLHNQLIIQPHDQLYIQLEK